MTDETDDEASEEMEVDYSPQHYTDTMDGPDGQIHFGFDAQTFLIHWVGKLGCEITGAAVMFGPDCAIWVVHPDTGECLTPHDIAKRAKMRVVQ